MHSARRLPAQNHIVFVIRTVAGGGTGGSAGRHLLNRQAKRPVLPVCTELSRRLSAIIYVAPGCHPVPQSSLAATKTTGGFDRRRSGEERASAGGSALGKAPLGIMKRSNPLPYGIK